MTREINPSSAGWSKEGADLTVLLIHLLSVLPYWALQSCTIGTILQATPTLIVTYFCFFFSF